ncbi:hypothetical protein [Kingella potus]|uniref:hypothetical protein n=1 Tax=Kingella potus TaxID=265175 RepID=UPI0015590AD8|nr:hypothetical protein [Kingella potus]
MQGIVPLLVQLDFAAVVQTYAAVFQGGVFIEQAVGFQQIQGVRIGDVFEPA